MWENPIQFSVRIECSSSSSSSSDLPQCFKIQLLHSEHVNLSKITEHKLDFRFPHLGLTFAHTHNTMFGRVFVLIRKPHLNYVFSDLFVCHSPCTRIRTCSDLHSSILRLCVDFPFYPIDGISVVGRTFQVSFDSLDTKGIRFASHSNNHTHILIHETGVRAAPITFTEQTHTHNFACFHLIAVN